MVKQLSVSLCDILNTSIVQGKWSKLWKFENVTPKVYPPKTPEDLRNISCLRTFNTVCEKIISELMIEDITTYLNMQTKK